MSKTPKLLFFISLLLFNKLMAQEKVTEVCKAELKNDTLVISNDRVELFYQWNLGDVKLVGVRYPKKKPVMFANMGEDLKLFHEQAATDASLATAVKSRFTGENEYLEVIVRYKLGTLEVKRIWEVFQHTSAVATCYYVKGTPGDDWLKTGLQQSNESIEDYAKMTGQAEIQRSLLIPLPDRHWQATAVSFQDVTDNNNTLVREYNFLPYNKPVAVRGNLLLLRNKLAGFGVFILKESPLENNQQNYPGADFLVSNSKAEVIGTSISKDDLGNNDWQRTYNLVIGLSMADETDQLLALHEYQKTIRALKPVRDEMTLCNTWGDRSRDSRMNEQFILKELESVSKLGITCLQLDDGWQQGLSSNSALKGSSKWTSWTAEDWRPNKERFPNGFDVIADKAKLLHVQLGVWFNPGSDNNYENWKRDASILIGLYHQYHITVFKIDGVELKNKQCESNLRKFYDEVNKGTEGNIAFDLDATAGRRAGYFFFNEYGNIFLENRYTDWSNYYPYTTMRNLWMLSRYMPAEKLQVEWLNKWRNIKNYAMDDKLAPAYMPWEYTIAVTLMAQPLAWMETSSLPAEAFEATPMLKKYNLVQHDIHSGIILPIGDMPDGIAWTGFQSIKDNQGFFMVYREMSDQKEAAIKTLLKPNQKILLMPVIGDGKPFSGVTDGQSRIKFYLQKPNSFALYAYKIIK